MNPKVLEINCETGEEVLRDMTIEELAQYQKDQTAEAKRQAEAQAKSAARQAILDRLGLTEEEAKLLLS